MQQLNVKTGGDTSLPHLDLILFTIGLCTLLFFIIIGSIMEHKNLIFGHETGVIILFGMLISFIGIRIHIEFSYKFPAELFFNLLLPLILFAAGYNMRRKEFFSNIVNIAKFGLFGSLFTFIAFVIMFWILFKYADMGMTQDNDLNWIPF